jgi:16S rRNA G527 N7-methylase RsmG
MHPARTAELLQPFLSSAVLSPTQLQSISTYIDLLQRWNARINLTAIRDEEEIVTRHFGESLFAASRLFPIYPVSSVPSVVKDVDVDPTDPAKPPGESDREGHDFSRADKPSRENRASAPEGQAEARSPKAKARLADLGSGAGFPGIPIKLWAPGIALTLIESNQKKSTFLRELSRALTLTEIDIRNVRAQTIASTFDVVTLRAVERLTQVLPAAETLLAPQGRLALLISSAQLDSTRSALPNLTWDDPVPIPCSDSRLLLIGHKEP